MITKVLYLEVDERNGVLLWISYFHYDLSAILNHHKMKIYILPMKILHEKSTVILTNV